MLYSIYHVTLKLPINIFGVNTLVLPFFYAPLKRSSLCNVTKSVNHKWFIDFIEWGDITPKRDVM